MPTDTQLTQPTMAMPWLLMDGMLEGLWIIWLENGVRDEMFGELRVFYMILTMKNFLSFTVIRGRCYKSIRYSQIDGDTMMSHG